MTKRKPSRDWRHVDKEETQSVNAERSKKTLLKALADYAIMKINVFFG
jgi:hypothetical protein